MLVTLISCVVLSACGGGGGSTAPVSAPAPSNLPASAAVTIPQSAAAPVATPQTPATSTDTEMASASLITVPTKTTGTTVSGDNVTDVVVQNTGATQTRVPFTFGQVFVPGHIGAGTTVTGRLADGSILPLQVDVKARHPDGSVRHAIISGVLPSLAAGATSAIGLVRTSATAAPAPSAPTALLNSGFSAAVKLTIDGKAYTASPEALLRAGTYTTWLSGAQVNEWHVTAPFKAADGSVHPQLSARFAVRYYGVSNKARVDFTVENGWAYQPAAQNVTYDVSLTVGATTTYQKAGLTHYHHARWRKLAWWGGAPAVDIRHNTAYLLATRALPNYDQNTVYAESVLNNYAANWTGAKTEPMGTGMAVPYMATTGGRQDIGIMPGWASGYLVSMDSRAKMVTLGTADLAGSYSSHYRDQKTDRPVSLVDYPYATNEASYYAVNSATQQSELLSQCAGAGMCTTPNIADTAHQPGFAYLPYLVTGDYYYLEELQFWGSFSLLYANPGLRDYAKGVLRSEQTRGMAWTMRTLFEAAYITPDNDRLKEHFASYVAANLAFFNGLYTDNPAANKLGVITHSYSMSYMDGAGIGPWQDDFFTSSMGHGAELGFSEARRMLGFKVTFPISRMIGAGACWIDASMYEMRIRASADAPFYTTIGEAYKATVAPELAALSCNSAEMAAYLKLKVGEMVGYAFAGEGYPSNMQPALAYAADVGGVNGRAAWTVFANRTVKPDNTQGNQFAIVPR